MIVRRYGNRFHSVALAFDPAALTEVGFKKDEAKDWTAEEFHEAYELIRVEEVTAEGADPVQDTAEKAMLAELEEKVMAIHDALEDGQLLSIESKSGVDHPRTRYHRPTKGERAFTYSLNHPLRLGVWSKK